MFGTIKIGFSDLRGHSPFLVVLCLTIAVRLWFALTYPIVQESDYAVYYEHAIGFSGMTNVYYNPIWTIGHSLLFAPLFALFGPSLRLIGIANTVIHLVSMVLLYLAAIRIFDRMTATATAAVSLVSLSDLFYNNLLCTEIPTTFFVSAMLYVLSRGSMNRRDLHTLGILGGLATYVRSNMILVPGILALLQSLIVGGGFRRALKSALRVQVVAVIATIPLCFYYLPAGKFTPSPPKLGRNLWLANNPYLCADPYQRIHGWHTELVGIPEDFPVGSEERRTVVEEYRDFYHNSNQTVVYDSLNAFQQDALFRRYALGWIGHNPGKYVKLIGARFVFLFFDSTYGALAYQLYEPGADGQPTWGAGDRDFFFHRLGPVSVTVYKTLILLAGLSILFCILRHRTRFLISERILPVLFALLLAIPYVMVHAVNRYHIPMLGLMWLYLGHCLAILVRTATSAAGRLRGAPSKSNGN